MKFRAPADLFLRRAQVVLLLAALGPTILTTPIGVILLVSGGSENVALVAGILVLSFCASSLAGFLLATVLLRRGATLVREQNHFLSLVSHELRTPMTSIRMFVEALLDDRLTDADERKRCLGVLRREVVRLDDLVGKLIDLSRLEGAERIVEQRPVSVSEVCDAAIASVQAMDFSASWSEAVTVEVEPDLYVLGDSAALTQAVGNLLSNAWKYTGEEKHVELRAQRIDDGRIQIMVADNGPGISSRERKLIFEKFTRGSAAARSTVGGSGLGLSLVWAIAAAHRGSVTVESTPGQGARFLLRLPAHSGGRPGEAAP